MVFSRLKVFPKVKRAFLRALKFENNAQTFALWR